MASSIQEFEELASQLAKHAEHMAALPRRAPEAAVDICGVWKVAKPFVELLIKLLNLLSFKWAKDAATGLQILDSAMNEFCPA